MDRLAGKVAIGIHDWWSACRTELGCLPGRQHVEPEKFRPFLSHVFMVDVEPGPVFKFRLHGTYMVNLWGRDFTGKSIGPETFGSRWRDVHECYQRTIRAKAPIATQEVVRHSSGFDIEVEVVHLPLAANGNDVDMVIGTVERTDYRWNRGAMPPEGTAKEWTIRSAVEIGAIGSV
jgi:hypothetical protein